MPDRLCAPACAPRARGRPLSDRPRFRSRFHALACKRAHRLRWTVLPLWSVQQCCVQDFMFPANDAAMTRHSHEIFDSKGASRKVAQWARAAWSGVATEAATEPATLATTPATPAPLHEGPHASGSAEGSAGGSAASHASLHAGPRVTGSASSSPRLPPLTTTRIGDKSRVVNGKAEWSQIDFARSFLCWFAETQPDDWGAWVWFPDISKHYFPRFRAATGARYLQLGSLIRGLRAVTQSRPVQYVDGTGRRRSTAEYWLGPS